MKQDTLKRIFEMASQELPKRVQDFKLEVAILHKGFRISKDKVTKLYKWEDTRYSNYYEDVDPNITKQILINGFHETLNEVMLHNDLEKIDLLERDIDKVNAKVKYWVTESSKLWVTFNKKISEVTKNKEIDEELKRVRYNELSRVYESKRNLYQKKRRVLLEMRDDLKENLHFYKARIKMYKIKNN